MQHTALNITIHIIIYIITTIIILYISTSTIGCSNVQSYNKAESMYFHSEDNTEDLLNVPQSLQAVEAFLTNWRCTVHHNMQITTDG